MVLCCVSRLFHGKVYLDEKILEVSFQLHATWFAYVALLPNDVQTNIHTQRKDNERKSFR